MECILNTQQERCRIELYNEYLEQIPKLLKQLETVEKMYEKALMEETLLRKKDRDNHSVRLYAQRIESIKKQCEERSADLREQCRLVMELKHQMEQESAVLRVLGAK